MIPAIDLLEGRAVRLRQGRYDDVTVYDGDPAALARRWSERAGRLHVVDLEGARVGAPVQRDAIRRLVEAFGDGVQVGGGVRTLETANAYFDLGVARVVLGTAAIRDPELVRRAALEHPSRVIVAVDAKDGMVATDGWLEVSTKSAVELTRELADAEIAGVLYTDIARDGTEVGPNIDATEQLARETGATVIASGGVGRLEHVDALARAARREGGISAVIIGRALHEGRFSLDDANAAAREPAPAS